MTRETIPTPGPFILTAAVVLPIAMLIALAPQELRAGLIGAAVLLAGVIAAVVFVKPARLPKTPHLGPETSQATATVSGTFTIP